jgi:hypothetical protein
MLHAEELRRPGCPTDLELEAVIATEEAALAAHGAHLKDCEHCAARLGWMRDAAQAFNMVVFPSTREKVVRRIMGGSWPGWWKWLVPLPIAAATAAAAIVLLVRPPEPEPDYVGVKGLGGPALEVYVGEAGPEGKVRRLVDGDRVHPGDGLRFVAQAPGKRVFIVTVDARGQVSKLYPASGTEPVPASGILPGGAVLDAVMGPERVYAVYVPADVTTIDLREVEAAARGVAEKGGPDAVRRMEMLPVEAEQQSVLLEKVPK